MGRILAAFALLAAFGMATLTTTPAAFAASGTFKGASKHETKGSVSIKKDGDGWVLVLGEDFWFDGAPDPKWAFGNDGVDKKTIFTPLEKNSGAQTYKIPANIDPSKYKEVILYCEKFSVPLGVAKLK